MLDEEKKTLSQVRLSKAKENLTAAYTLISAGDYKIASTRTYYAVFHAMRAVLALDGVDMKHHSGVISEFRKRYLKTEIIDRKMSATISELFDLRTDCDYDDFFVISKEETKSAATKADEFVKVIEDYLNSVYEVHA